MFKQATQNTFNAIAASAAIIWIYNAILLAKAVS